MNLDGNYIDLIIIFGLIYFGSNAFNHGFWVLMADFAAFSGSLIFSLRTYKFLSDILRVNFAITPSIANALGFLLSAIILESLLGVIFGLILKKLPQKIIRHKLSKILGIIPALGEGLILISFLLTLMMSLPVRPVIKSDIEDSKIGSLILRKTVVVEKLLGEVFGGVINDSLTYLTIKPEAKESIPLETRKTELTIDESSEALMFSKVNEERRKMNVVELVWEPKLGPVARSHDKDMWERKYFSHYSPEGDDVGDRLNEAGVLYSFAGENLALAPTVQTAHTGLMNSEGHRENILEPKFKKIGIGVVDNGVYGKMFVQVFTD